KITALMPDLVLAFSDLQADIVSALVRAGVQVHVFNQRDIAGILAMIRTLGSLVDAAPRANALADAFARRIEAVEATARQSGWRPKVYFEEWDEPMISGIGWVSELIGIAGGTDVFAHLGGAASATERIVPSDQVIAAAPDVMLASWCGKKVVVDKIRHR